MSGNALNLCFDTRVIWGRNKRQLLIGGGGEGGGGRGEGEEYQGGPEGDMPGL